MKVGGIRPVDKRQIGVIKNKWISALYYKVSKIAYLYKAEVGYFGNFENIKVL